jgi:EAL domain-containing protein (putative c-di-GMP-specific phosphodiesterase class I)/GGDEF domain-containing protein
MLAGERWRAHPVGAPAALRRRGPAPPALPAEARDIQPYFQPVLDLLSGRPLGYEVLARPLSGEPPEEMFARAAAAGRLWEVDRACRTAALRRIAELAPRHPGARFFLNVSPAVFCDPRFAGELDAAALRALDLDPGRLVLEITERDSIVDDGRFELLVRRHVEQGLRFALDDFGAGHSSLVALIRCAPHFVKLDRALVQRVDRTPYKQQLVKALVVFSRGVDTELIGEGVETLEELETLLQLGVRYVQGYLVAAPAAEPPPTAPQVQPLIAATMRKAEAWAGGRESTLRDLVLPSLTAEAGTLTAADVGGLLRGHPEADHLCLVHHRRPAGLITGREAARARRCARTRPAEEIANQRPLAVEEHLPLAALYRLAMSRPGAELYDPVLVTDGAGDLLGTVTVRQLLRRAAELEIRAAAGTSPLTGLPGEVLVRRWVEDALAEPPFTVVYADLDHLAAYNGRYGVLRGDEMILLAARVLARGLGDLGPGLRLAHLGADDFVAVCPRLDEPTLERICREFDRLRTPLYDPEDRRRGTFRAPRAAGRRGRPTEVPLVTLSLAVVASAALDGDLHPARLAQTAATLQGQAKALTATSRRSTYVYDRRRAGK